MDFLWDNFGLLEVLLSLELITLLTAAIFYQVAKIIARTDRQDPLLRFYRVFWLRFFSSVASMKEMDLQAAEYYARQSGVTFAGDVDPNQLANLDAAELVDIDEIGVQRNQPGAGSNEQGAPTAKAIGRRGPEGDDRLSIVRGGETESREARFLREQKESPRQPIQDDEPIRIDTSESRPPAGRKDKLSSSSSGEYKAATSIVQIRVVPASLRDEIIGIAQGEVVIKITTPPEDGKANAIVIDLLAKQLGVRPYQISLLGGHYKLRKTVQVAGIDQATANARLQ